ncbi:35888_t:CDS:2, partial [Racocetra persica]
DDISESKRKLEKVTPVIDVENFICYYINNCINCREDGSHKNNQKGSYASIGVYYEDGTKKITEPLPEDLQTNN